MNNNEFYKNLVNLYRLQQARMKILVNLIADFLDGDESKKEELRKFILIDTNLHELIDG